MTWTVWATDEGAVAHVTPDEDFREHDISKTCWCNPKPDGESPHILIHNSLDQREFVERGNRMVQ